MSHFHCPATVIAATRLQLNPALHQSSQASHAALFEAQRKSSPEQAECTKESSTSIPLPPPLAKAPDAARPKALSQISYRKLGLLGKGSFGAVYLVEAKATLERYAVKEIPCLRMSKEERANAIREVQILRKLTHEHIIAYRGAIVHEGVLILCMEYADGGDMHQRIRERNGVHFSESKILVWLAQLCSALSHMHSKKILHRDLKTQNIFLTRNDDIKLGDFGISRVLNSTLDHARTLVGTPYYLSPELCESKPYDHKSDMWAVGCVLYEMTTLKHAFDAQSIRALVLKIINGRYPPIPSFYSRQLALLIDRLLSLDPKQRPDSSAILSDPLLANTNARLASPSLCARPADSSSAQPSRKEHRASPNQENSPESPILAVAPEELDGRLAARMVDGRPLPDAQASAPIPQRIPANAQDAPAPVPPTKLHDSHGSDQSLAVAAASIMNSEGSDCSAQCNSVFHRTEALRAFLETQLGVEAFGAIYTFMVSLDADAKECAVEKTVMQMLGKKRRSLYSVLVHLLVCEQKLYKNND